MKLFKFIFIIFSCITYSSFGQIKQHLTLPNVFSNNMVLQRDTTKIVGKAKPNAIINLSISDRTISTKSNSKGVWKSVFYGLKAGGPYELKITSEKEVVRFKNVLIGDVWLASGQSNMEWSPTQGVDGWAEEKRKSTYQNIRLFKVKRNLQIQPQDDLHNHSWQHCNSDNLSRFSAVAYFFAKHIHNTQKIPIGIINASFGGTRIEDWMSVKALKKSKTNYPTPLSYQKFQEANQQRIQDIALRNEFFEKVNVGERLGVHKPNYNDKQWNTIQCPQNWKDNQLRKAGFVWFRKQFLIKNTKDFGDSIKLSFGNIKDDVIIYFNGKQLKAKTEYTNTFYTLSTKFLQKGNNTLAVRIVKKLGPDGGFIGKDSDFYIAALSNPKQKINLAGNWKYNKDLEPVFPRPFRFNPRTSLLFNGMITPLTSLKIKGFLWYQGESNASKNAVVYDDLLASLILDWRNKFNTNNAPFFVVQLPNWHKNLEQPSNTQHWPWLRESQANVSKLLPNVDFIVTLDLGNPNDIHPTNKKDVGYRLGVLAEKKVYNNTEANLFPKFKNVKIKKKSIIVYFSNVDKSLVVKDGKKIREFAIAGNDGIFYWAKVKINKKNAVKLKSQAVKKPLYVRYAWQDNPNINLYNANGLPVAPFRTDNFNKTK